MLHLFDMLVGITLGGLSLLARVLLIIRRDEFRRLAAKDTKRKKVEELPAFLVNVAKKRLWLTIVLIGLGCLLATWGFIWSGFAVLITTYTLWHFITFFVLVEIDVAHGWKHHRKH
jgi:small-conductance mechanosensitive channel